jgi:hypothetical protein
MAAPSIAVFCASPPKIAAIMPSWFATLLEKTSLLNPPPIHET